MEVVEIDLRNWVNAEQWRVEHASSVFITPASWTWFKRRNRKKLVEAGVLILGSGRQSDSVDSSKISGVIQKIRLAESIERFHQSGTLLANPSGGGAV